MCGRLPPGDTPSTGSRIHKHGSIPTLTDPRWVALESSKPMNTAQLLFRARKGKKHPEFLDKVQSYLAALSQNGQIIGEATVAKVIGGYLVTASLPEPNALAGRFANKWVR